MRGESSAPWTFGQWCRSHRRTADLTQAQLARLVGCATITIRKIEADERRPSRLMAERIANVFGITGVNCDLVVEAARCWRAPVIDRRTGRSETNTRSGPTHRLSLGGHQRALARAAALLAAGGGPARVVTITGPRGSGKSRLAHELATWLTLRLGVLSATIDAAGETTRAGVFRKLAHALDVSDDDFDSSVLGRALVGRPPMLLILDDLDHVHGAAAMVLDLLSPCPGLSCLVTRRRPLGVRGEAVVALAQPAPQSG